MIMKFLKHFTLMAIVVTLFIAASPRASAHPRIRGGFFINAYPNAYPEHYDYGFYQPAPWSFGYYRGRPSRGFDLGFSRGRFGFTYESNRGRRRHRRDNDRRSNRRNND
tara:strand:+ start:226 stop:552 length:327 start_codon:yes stop_codon:yes gene_type:complete